MRQPLLHGNGVRLRPLTEADRAALRDAVGDPLIWEQHPDRTRHTPDGFARWFADALHSGGALVIEDDRGRVIGSSRFHWVDHEGGRLEIGWTFLVRDHWGGPTNGEVKRLMLTHAFEHRPTVEFHIGTQNMRSRRAVEKLGAVRIDRPPRERDHVVYEIDAERYGRAT